MRWPTSSTWLRRRERVDLTAWHQWYAWRPQIVGDHWVWLEWIERRYRVFVAPQGVSPWAYRIPSLVDVVARSRNNETC
jgi:hypothetical protein